MAANWPVLTWRPYQWQSTQIVPHKREPDNGGHPYLVDLAVGAIPNDLDEFEDAGWVLGGVGRHSFTDVRVQLYQLRVAREGHPSPHHHLLTDHYAQLSVSVGALPTHWRHLIATLHLHLPTSTREEPAESGLQRLTRSWERSMESIPVPDMVSRGSSAVLCLLPGAHWLLSLTTRTFIASTHAHTQSSYPCMPHDYSTIP